VLACLAEPNRRVFPTTSKSNKKAKAKMAQSFVVPLCLLFYFLTNTPAASSCRIHGTDSGQCTVKYLPETYSTHGNEHDLEAIQIAKSHWMADMPYCGRFIANYYSPCVPSKPTPEWTSPDANFQYGRLTTEEQSDTASILAKDQWVEATVSSTISQRIEMERQKGSNHYKFYKNKDCQEAFARYTCWLNFPRCDENDESLPLCQSACENLFRVCRMESDLWRCETDVVHGDDEYDVRGFFPGQPFRENEFIPKSDGEPRGVCTPSIKGSASVLGVGVGYVCMLAATCHWMVHLFA
jgi:hypothetical protein